MVERPNHAFVAIVAVHVHESSVGVEFFVVVTCGVEAGDIVPLVFCGHIDAAEEIEASLLEGVICCIEGVIVKVTAAGVEGFGIING